MKKPYSICFVFSFLLLALCVPLQSYAQLRLEEDDRRPSIPPDLNGGDLLLNNGDLEDITSEGTVLPESDQFLQYVDKSFEGFWFEDNLTEVGGYGIPPDPMGAAGKNSVIAVVNVMIESRTKGGKLKWRDALKDFFAPLNPLTYTFDPKIIYDNYEDRFVVVTLEAVGSGSPVSPGNISRILLAVSKDGNPKSPTENDWYYQAIDSKVTFEGIYDMWADYPGLELDEEAIYVNATMLFFPPYGALKGSRLWIVDKGSGSGGFYDGGISNVSFHNPYSTSETSGYGSRPVQVLGENGVGGGGSTLGTFLIRYDTRNDLFGIEVGFMSGGSGLVQAANQWTYFNYSYDAWIPIEVIVDLDLNWCELWVDNIKVHEFQWSLGSWNEGALSLEANNFAGLYTDGPRSFYIDNYELTDISTTPTTIFSDDFDSYTAGVQLALQNPTDWTTWNVAPGSSEDGIVSSDKSVSPSNSVYMFEGNNQLKAFPDRYTSGKYSMSFQIYIPTGFTAYFNTMASITDKDPNASEYLQVTTIDDPLGKSGGPFFTEEFVWVDDIDIIDFIPDAPQAGSPYKIDNNTRRVYDAVWRDNALWAVGTIIPKSGVNAGQTTAHWFKLNTSSGPGSIVLDQQGDIGGEDIAPGTYTFFPSVAVNRDGTAAFGFSASAPTIFAGAYVTGRAATDPPGTVRPTELIKEGKAPYKRYFSRNRNRWGDYSGISVDPTNDDFFWVFNEYAEEQGSPTYGWYGYEDGRWGTVWGRVKFTGPPTLPKTILADNTLIPKSVELHQNYPNPFNPSTTINYQVPENSFVSIKVYDLLGKEVASLVNEEKSAGNYDLRFDASKLSSGFYLYTMKAGNFVETKKMLLMK